MYGNKLRREYGKIRCNEWITKTELTLCNGEEGKEL